MGGDRIRRPHRADMGHCDRAPIGQPLLHAGAVWSASFSPDGKWVVTASIDHTARLWDAATGAPLGKALAHNGRVYSAMFSPDGARVVTASGDIAARIWDAVTGRRSALPCTMTIGLRCGV